MSEQERTVRVDLRERSYDILIGRGTLGQCASFLQQRCNSSHAVLITDTNVDPLHGDRVADLLTEQELEVDVMVIEAGEGSKSADVAHQLWETMLEQGADRQSMVVAVGGGVVGDVAGFVAATFARGVPFFQIPTTLLAQVDSSVGGKVGINLSEAKNMVGAFWQPRGVLIDVDVLSTLPDRDYRAGLAEVVKYGVILDAEFFSYLEQQADAINRREPEVLEYLIERSCRLKADVVEADEREESGRRAILNYGHTFGHAFEALGDYEQWLHGEAVAIGMECAARLAARLGRFDPQSAGRQSQLLEKLGLEVRAPSVPFDDLLKLMWHDKKVQSGRLRLVLPSSIGHVGLVDDVRNDDIQAAVEEVLAS